MLKIFVPMGFPAQGVEKTLDFCDLGGIKKRSREEPTGSSRLGDDVLRWVRWLTAGLPWDVWGRHPCSAHTPVDALLPFWLRA
jgi:hypothetical protein